MLITSLTESGSLTEPLSAEQQDYYELLAALNVVNGTDYKAATNRLQARITRKFLDSDESRAEPERPGENPSGSLSISNFLGM